MERELAEGDLIRVPERTPRLYIHHGHGVEPVNPLGLLRSQHPSVASLELAKRLGGDLSAFWEAADNAEDLLWLAWRKGLEGSLLVASACDCVETSLRFVPEGEVSPSRSVRTTRRWLAWVASAEEMEKAREASFHVAYEASLRSASASLAAAAASSAPSAASAASAAHAVADAHVAAFPGAATHADVARSLTFLVRVRLPAWKVCLLLARKGGA